MGRNGRGMEPEFLEGAVRIEDLNMSVAAVQDLGFRLCVHWSGALAVSERDAHAISQRQRMIAEQREAERRRCEVERAEKMAVEFAATVPRGAPAQPNMSALEVMLAANEDERPPSAFIEMLDDALAAGKGA
jgi:hypothetical protein